MNAKAAAFFQKADQHRTASMMRDIFCSSGAGGNYKEIMKCFVYGLKYLKTII